MAQRLIQEIERAEIVAAEHVPPDVVTMNSVVRVRDRETGERLEVTVSWPEEADVRCNRVSVLAPLGMALLGARAGDHLVWRMPSGDHRLYVEKVIYQPESGEGLTLQTTAAGRAAEPCPV